MQIILTTLTLMIVLAGCNNSDFAGNQKTKSNSGSKDKSNSGDEIDSASKKSDAGDADASDADDGDDDNDEDSDSARKKDDSSDSDIEIDEAEKLNKPELCWFAVSGAYLGCHGNGKCDTYQNVFPGTTSGKTIKHGETFDTVGGVYLNSSDTPYEFGKGNREIDGAVNTTFDGIAVAPGMKVEIRDGNGAVLLDQEGPLLRYSSDYGGKDNPASLVPYFQSKQSMMPPWMLKAFQEAGWKPQRIPLHAAKWVKVSKLKGVACD